jgi:hypothetical protein
VESYRVMADHQIKCYWFTKVRTQFFISLYISF